MQLQAFLRLPFDYEWLLSNYNGSVAVCGIWWVARDGGNGAWGNNNNVWYFYYLLVINKIKTYCVLVKYLNTFSVILKIRGFSAGDANKISSNSYDAGTGQWEMWALENGQMSALPSAPKAVFRNEPV
jgi:hypothetical protein